MRTMERQKQVWPSQDRPEGPYKLLGSYDLNYVRGDDQGFDGNHLGSVRDMNLFVDDDDDKAAYVIYSSQGNKTTFISRLNQDYTGLVVPKDAWGGRGAFYYQLQRLVKRSSGHVQIQQEILHGPTPAVPAGRPTRQSTQWRIILWDRGQTWAIPVMEPIPIKPFTPRVPVYFLWMQRLESTFYMGDRWNSDDLSESRYVWLPVEFRRANRLGFTGPYSNWTLDELDNKGLAYITSEIPEQSPL